ncbi:MAG: 3-oxoacyl-ACP reductase [Betaproteobacteria bacterium HGW-Betaproteobacteria-12]|nr:MAG: 3-oxoacyl-ACP reductase [Betaproteobacteria bacterium HGW-Betaproteobacteria-12]
MRPGQGSGRADQALCRRGCRRRAGRCRRHRSQSRAGVIRVLNDKIALVTGATRGIGRAIALELGRLGATVIGTATSDDGAGKISAYLAEAGVKGSGVVLNVTDIAQTDTVLAELAKKFGAITILVNNAGITRDNLAMRMGDDEWDAVIDTNLKAVFRLSRGVMRGMMKARFGRIVNISSVVGYSGNAGQANYCAAKAGVAGLSRSLARELGSRNITVNCVAPGFIATDMTHALTEEQKTAMIAAIPLARAGTPEDVAGAVAFLISPAASYVTGTTIHVNGGMYMD